MIDPGGLPATSDALVGLVVAIPVLVVAGGVAVGLRFRGRGTRERVPTGEVASDAPTDIELERSADATRRAEPDRSRPPARSPAPSVAEAPAPPPAEPVVPEPEPEPEPEPPTYRGRLGKARGLLSGYVGAIRSRGKIDATTWDDLEEALIRADVGVGATDALLDGLRPRVKSGDIAGPDALVDALKADMVSMLTTGDSVLALPGRADRTGDTSPDNPGTGDTGTGDTGTGDTASADTGSGDADSGDPVPEVGTVDVWLFVGVNGVGKTTTVGKVANRLTASGTKVLLAAGDTFRAAAGEQLALWASRADADIVRGSEGGDPSSVVYDAVERAASRGHAVVLADTAGRLHNKVNLVKELEKIRRVADRPPGRVVEVLLVLDATTGQNGLAQAKVFLDAVDVTGVVLTKLDGTAKGGIVVAIQRELGLPVKLVGLGEGVDDLIDFDPAAFVDALF